MHDVRSEFGLTLEQMGIRVRYHHHEVGAPGQCEIEVGLAPLARAADQAMTIEYVVKNVGRQRKDFVRKIAPPPRTLCDALDARAADHSFLARGEVAPERFIGNRTAAKRREETDEIAVRPHPYECPLYLDC